MFKKIISTLFVCCLLFTGCSSIQNKVTKLVTPDTIEIEDNHFNLKKDQFADFLAKQYGIDSIPKEHQDDLASENALIVHFAEGDFIACYRDDGYIHTILMGVEQYQDDTNTFFESAQKLLTLTTDIEPDDWHNFHTLMEESTEETFRRGETNYEFKFPIREFDIRVIASINPIEGGCILSPMYILVRPNV